MIKLMVCRKDGGTLSTRLVWFRSDLRVTDNRALLSACAGRDTQVHGVFVVTPGQWQAHDWGANKVHFTLRNVNVLQQELANLNIPLHVLNVDDFAATPKAILKLAQSIRAQTVEYNGEYEFNEVERDEQFVALAEEAGIEAIAHHDQTVVPPNAVKTGEGNFYSVFSPYKRAWLKLIDEGCDWEPAGKPVKRRALPCSGDKVPNDIPGYDFREDIAQLWPAGESEAGRRLERFAADLIDNYKQSRDVPSMNATSTLSPYLSTGVISPRQCLAQAVEANQGKMQKGKQGPDCWISELIWREFYRHVITGWPRVCKYRAFRPETEQLKWNDDEELFQAWCEGKTGVPIVDAGIRQLLSTGWMHNRLRMVVAMFLTKDCFIDWRKGERFFMQHLVDADLASNNGGWQWSASTGTDAAPYFRIFNPYSQSKRFDPKGTFIRQYIPELAKLPDDQIHEPHQASGLFSQIDYPQPIVDHKTARESAIQAFKNLKN